jgi:RND family efflux transporter MFP subunit
MKRILLSALVGAGLLWLAACKGSPPRVDKPSEAVSKKVTVVAVERSSERSVERIMGTVIPRNRAEIQTKVQARIERIPVKLGSRVQKGNLLVEFDTREFNARVEQARAGYEQTAADLTRYDSLLARRVVAQQEYDVVKARATVAEALLHEAEALLSYARIEAPFAGVVTQKLVDIGDLTVPGRLLLVLEEDAPARFLVNIPESRGGNVAIGDILQVELPSADTILSGRVEELSPSAEISSRSYRAKIILDDGAKVQSGQFGRLLLPTGHEESLFVPVSAVVNRGQLELVFVATSDKRAVLRLVRTGRRFPDKVEILAGLGDSDRVVTGNPAALSDGEIIEEQP